MTMEIPVPESVPESLLHTLEHDVFNYTRNLIGHNRFLTEEEKKSIHHIENELYRVQAELQSVAHERVVIDVLSRPVMTEIEHNRGRRLQASKEEYLQRRSGVEQPSSNAPRSTGSRRSNGAPEDPIFIPPYIPAYLKDLKSSSSSHSGATTTAVGGGITGSHSYGTSINHVAVRATGSTTLVPSMRSGYFPPEYKNLRMTPVDYTHPTRPTTTSADNLKIKKKKKKTVSFEPLARSLQSKLLTTSQEMKRLKDRLAKTDNKFNKERAKSTRKLKLILDALEEKQLWKDHALMAAVEQLIQETLESFQDVVDEVDLLQILEEIVAQIPQPFIYEVPLSPPAPIIERPAADSQEMEEKHFEPKEENYSIINVQKRPTIIRLPEPVEKAEIDVQTEPVEEEEEEVPPPPPPMSFPSTTQVQSPTIIEVTKPSVEKDLLAILNTVVDSNKAAMQGQQAIILSLVQELAEKSEAMSQPVAPPQVIIMPAASGESQPPPVIPKEDKIVDTADLPAAIEEVSLVTTPPAVVEPLVQEVRPSIPPYRTAFGQVVLGGKGLTGPYAAPPKQTLPQALALAGLDEFGEIVNPPTHAGTWDTPVKRRAKPLTMMLLNRPAPAAPPSAPVAQQPLTAETFVDFAQKLLETVSGGNKQPTDSGLSKADVMQAVQDGVKVGVRTALGYWEDDVDDDFRRGYRAMGMVSHSPRQKKGFPLHQLVERECGETENDGYGKRSARRVLLEAEDDPLDLHNVRQARDESRQRTKQFLQQYREEIRDSSSVVAGGAAWDDLLSLADDDEEFHALYGDRHDLSLSQQSRDTSKDTNSSTSSFAVLNLFEKEEEEDADRRFMRQATEYRRHPLHSSPRETKSSASSPSSPHDPRRAGPILRSHKVQETAIVDTSSSVLSRYSDAPDALPDTRDHSHRHRATSRSLVAPSSTTVDPRARHGWSSEVGDGLPPLVSSVLPHHATRVARDSGFYRSPLALMQPHGTKDGQEYDIDSSRDVQSSWASSFASVRHSPPARRRVRSQLSTDRIQARTKPRSHPSGEHPKQSFGTSSNRRRRSSSSSSSSSSRDSGSVMEKGSVDDSDVDFPSSNRRHKQQQQQQQRLPHDHPVTTESVNMERSSLQESQEYWSGDSSDSSRAPLRIPSNKTHHRQLESKHSIGRGQRKKDALLESDHRSIEDEDDDAELDEDDADRSMASASIASSLYSFNTSHSSVANDNDFLDRHVSIPLLSVGTAAATRGKPRWKV